MKGFAAFPQAPPDPGSGIQDCQMENMHQQPILLTHQEFSVHLLVLETRKQAQVYWATKWLSQDLNPGHAVWRQVPRAWPQFCKDTAVTTAWGFSAWVE